LRNNSLAMLATITGVGILAWAIGFFDPTTCTPNVQQEGWTSCAAIAQERTIALWILILGTLGIVLFLWLQGRKKN
jgi:hypothetical protein